MASDNRGYGLKRLYQRTVSWLMTSMVAGSNLAIFGGLATSQSHFRIKIDNPDALLPLMTEALDPLAINPARQPPAKILPPDQQPISQHWAVQRALQTVKENPSTTNPSLVGVYRTADGRISNQALHNDSKRRRDFASVGKMVTLAIVDDPLKEGKITLDQKIYPQYAKEYGLSSNTTVRDAIQATYYWSNNYAAQALLKTAIHADMQLGDKDHVSGLDAAEYVLRYMKKNGFDTSAQFNGPGYPENSDWVSETFSPPGVPSRATGHSPGELARFFAKKYCVSGNNPDAISSTMQSLINLQKSQSPTSVVFNHYGYVTDAVYPHGLQAVARDTLITGNTKSVIAKSGTSNNSTGGMVAVTFKDGSCKVDVGGGLVENRDYTIPGAISKIRTDTIIAKAPTVNPLKIGNATITAGVITAPQFKP